MILYKATLWVIGVWGGAWAPGTGPRIFVWAQGPGPGPNWSWGMGRPRPGNKIYYIFYTIL